MTVSIILRKSFYTLKHVIESIVMLAFGYNDKWGYDNMLLGIYMLSYTHQLEIMILKPSKHQIGIEM